ncbi:MAG: sporulation protein [Clostridium sp.]|jgi:uncharacterized spore protein YtfJ|uniref:GerW family sporulation protein n=1 Tax=Clostridium sp. TaxID=1506 RepID=UPI0025B83E08|nr:spore germination protein GerW family protein [Clostridium sp.]MCH3965979.1 sporulation protein [Clostridium sp.]MCI1715933.1 sporulation protein [Clostridium sp.]MCI1800395.1 sporulation protein [Clostridium sp.]MCI1814110.1 sporulation protein [Clostridium sp.]MCI1871008.1 sporulation protein [Clostridium sp.]
MDIKENAEALFSKLENFFKTETVVGKPIKIDDEITLVPFITVTFGCGTGTGEGTDPGKKQSGEGGGLGAGARITPDAVLVIKGEMVQMIPIRNKGNLDKLVELVPGIIEKLDKGIKEHKAKKEAK